MMNFYNYLQETNRTWASQGSTTDRIHIRLGIFSEFGKFCGELKKEFQYNTELNRESVLLELGDLCYYLARWTIEHMKTDETLGMAYKIYHPSYNSIHELTNDLYTQLQALTHLKSSTYLHGALLTISCILSSLGFTLEECLTKNIIKLSEKHPEKYTQSMLNILKQQA